MLRKLKRYFVRKDLELNTVKSKILVFRRGRGGGN